MCLSPVSAVDFCLFCVIMQAIDNFIVVPVAGKCAMRLSG